MQKSSGIFWQSEKLAVDNFMASSKQLKLIKDPRKGTKLWWIQKQYVYGGSLSYRKVPRPFDSKKLCHTVFKADLMPNLGFSRFARSVRPIIIKSARRYGIQIHDMALQENHIHLLSYTKSRKGQLAFNRFLSAELGRFYARLRRRLGYSARTLWIERPFSRLVSWGRRSLSQIKNYIRRNRLEAIGFVKWQPRNHRLSEFLAIWSQSIIPSGRPARLSSA